MQSNCKELLEGIANQVSSCTACELHQTRTNAVPGEGPADAKVFFVGEAPGADEDSQARPFVGRSGQLLRQTIRDVGLAESEVYIGNVLKCRPPGNRDPKDSEIAVCRQFLEAQISLIQPRVIVTLGRFSMNLLISPELKITKARGQHIKKSGQLFLPTWHPSAVLRDRNRLESFRRDLAVAKKLAESVV